MPCPTICLVLPCLVLIVPIFYLRDPSFACLPACHSATGVIGLPAGGAVIGALAAVTAPLLWPLATQLCWAPDMRSFLLGGGDLTWLMDVYFK